MKTLLKIALFLFVLYVIVKLGAWLLPLTIAFFGIFVIAPMYFVMKLIIVVAVIAFIIKLLI